MNRHRTSKPRRNLLNDDSGAVLHLVTVLIPVMMALIGLVVDGTRLYILNTEQQDLADAAALAGARELDGEDDALTRAENAARTLVQNDPRWASDPEPEAQIASVNFCEELTGAPHQRVCDGYTTDPRIAHFIEVVAETRLVFPSFLNAIGAVSRPASNTIAIAGTSIVACNVQSLMICNPFEDPATPGVESFEADPGQMFVFKAKDTGGGGGNASFAPGDFGLVDHPDYPTGGGAGATRDLLSMQSRPICIHNLVSPHQGHETNKVNQGINVRFDEKSFNCVGQCKADMTSAPHALKGTTTACSSPNPGPYEADQQYPDDTAYSEIGSLQIGNGQMDPVKQDAYWDYHHGGTWPADVDTRYAAYLYELDMIANGTWGKEPKPEEPAPMCLPENTAGSERRVINAAVIDCLKHEVKGNSVNKIRADTYVEFFVTRPADGGVIYTEFIRMMTPETHDTKIHRIVQLYR